MRAIRWCRENIVKFGALLIGKLICNLLISSDRRFISYISFWLGFVILNSIWMLSKRMERNDYDVVQNSVSNLNNFDKMTEMTAQLEEANKKIRLLRKQVDKINETTAQLEKANKNLRFLEKQVINLNGRLPKPYPAVKHRNYRNKKRILVMRAIDIYLQ